MLYGVSSRSIINSNVEDYGSELSIENRYLRELIKSKVSNIFQNRFLKEIVILIVKRT